MTAHFRNEIAGLRAIAVIGVVLFHLKVAAFQGGFVGVDVFFVISGYLITRNILRDLDTDRFSFGGFYVRRTRRILPALSVVMLACIPFAWAICAQGARDFRFDFGLRLTAPSRRRMAPIPRTEP